MQVFDDGQQPFSKRHGYQADVPPITIREEAPQDFRYYMLYEERDTFKPTPSEVRSIICRVRECVDRGAGIHYASGVVPCL